MRAIMHPHFGHPVVGPTATYGAAYGLTSRQEQVQTLMDQGYTRKQANEILNLDVGGGKSAPAWTDIVGGILDVGGQVVSTVTNAQQQARSNAGYDVAAADLANQQALLDLQRRGGAVQQPARSSNTAMYAVLGLGAVVGTGLIIYAATRK